MWRNKILIAILIFILSLGTGGSLGLANIHYIKTDITSKSDFFMNGEEGKFNNLSINDVIEAGEKELNVLFNFEKKVNQSLKNLIYLEFYSKFFLFKYITKIWIQFNKPFYKKRKARDISLRYIVLINFLIKITPKKYIKEIDDKHKRLLEEIKNYHSKDYREFKNKINSLQKN